MSNEEVPAVPTTNVHGPQVARRRLGAKLKDLRAEKGYGLEVVAKNLEFSSAKLSRLETGQVAPKLRDVRDLLDMYDVPSDLRQRLMHWAEDAKEHGWWEPLVARTAVDLNLYISLEAEAQSMKIYCNSTVPGLLQIESYARAVLNGAAPQNSPEVIEQLVDVRLRRQRVLADDLPDGPLRLEVIIDEAGLHRGNPEILQDQLAALLTQSMSPHVSIRVFPYAAGFDEAHSTFAIFYPREPQDWTVVNVESTVKDHFYDSKDDVSTFEAIWDDLKSRSLGTTETHDLIGTLIAKPE